MVSDLQEIDRRQSARREERIDVVLDIARQQDPAPVDLAEQDDRDVVDRATAVGRLGRDASGVRPEHVEVEVVDRESIAGDEEPSWRRPDLGKLRIPRPVARARAAHARFEDPPDPVAIQQQRQPGDVVLVGMGEHEDVDPPVPRRETLVELDDQPVRIGSSVDEHPSASSAFDEDRITLPDVEDGDGRRSVRAVGHREPDRDERDREGSGHDPARPPARDGPLASCARARRAR